jgi:glycosyltransferase involved in cell wall biosynthesis
MSQVKTRAMRIGIDSRDAFASQVRGVGKTLRLLLDHLLPLMPEWSVFLYTNRRNGFTVPGPAHTRLIDIRGDRWNAWDLIRLPLAAFTDRLDLLHCPAQTAPPVLTCPLVLTVHDLIPLRIGDGWGQRQVARFRRLVTRSVAAARRIIAVSEFTARELAVDFPFAARKIDVVHWGADHAFLPRLSADDWESLCRMHDIRSPFFIAFGGLAPRKNVIRILAAFRTFTRDGDGDAQLLLIGTPPAGQTLYRKACDEAGLEKRVRILPYLDDAQVSELLARAVALVYPSLYEGFGLPVLEAMAAGAPVITSNTTCLPAVAGGAALLVDPTDVEAIADAMMACYVDTALVRQLVAHGRRRAASFTWESAARETLAVYRRALGAA